MTTKQKIFTRLISFGMTAAGAAGLMGNLYAESALKPQNLQNTYEKKIGFTDAEYTAAVDSGKYTDFVTDCAGYGLAQWTYHSRKAALLAYARNCGKSIGDPDMQLDFLLHELTTDYPKVLETLCTTNDIRTASDAVMLEFERPADVSEQARAKRAAYAQGLYDELADKPTQIDSVPFLVQVTCTALNVRAGAGTHHKITAVVHRGEVYTIVEAAQVGGSTWGRLKSGAGWINIGSKYCKRV